MARVTNPKISIVSRVLTLVTSRMRDINSKLTDEIDTSGRLDSTYQGGLDASFKADGAEIIKLIRWLVEVELGLTPPFNNSSTPATSTLSPAVTLAEAMEYFNGHAASGADTTIGQEEYCRTRLLTTTTWELNQTVAPNSAQSVHRFAVVDWNDSGVVVQRGQNSMAAGSTTDTLTGGGTDFNTVDFTRSMFFIEGHSSEANFSVPTDQNFANAVPNGDNIDITRQASGFVWNYNWVIVEFPVGFASVQHVTHTMGGGTTSNSDTITALTDFPINSL